jgi:O-acetyl-ADP-ribose deacetylase (regulator of RNase III)
MANNKHLHDGGIEVGRPRARMLTYVHGSLFKSRARTLVNTVNIEGVMGKGVAAEFKARFPDMFREYHALCKSGVLDIGKLHLWKGPDRWVLNFPTKTTWRRGSKIEYIEAGLEKFVKSYQDMEITSIAFPPLGCGNGGLSWEMVRPVMEKYLSKTDANISIHDRQVSGGFVPEHRKDFDTLPTNYNEFLSDVSQLISRSKQVFERLSDGAKFILREQGGEGYWIERDERKLWIPIEVMEECWTALQIGYLTTAIFNDAATKRMASFLFAVLARLGYVDVVRADPLGAPSAFSGAALYIVGTNHAHRVGFPANRRGSQACLFPQNERSGT